MNESLVPMLQVKMLGKVGSKEGQTLFRNYTAVLQKPTCDFSKFEETTAVITDLFEDFNSSLSTVELNTLRYKIDTVTFLDGYSSCQDFVDNLTTSTKQPFNVTGFTCQQESGTTEWSSDPCWYSHHS